MRLVDGFADIGDVAAFVRRIDRIGAECGCAVQAFDARYVAGKDHLAAAVDHANRAYARDAMIATDRAIEILCYAAGRRQINQALELGVKAASDPVPVVLVITGEDESRADALIREIVSGDVDLQDVRDDPAIREFFDITDAEFDATDASLQALVIERVALLTVEK